MRRIVVLTLFALLAIDAAAQHRPGAGPAAGPGFGRASYPPHPRGFAFPSASGYGFLPYDDAPFYSYPPQPVLFVQPPPPPAIVEPPPPPVHPVVIEYKQPTAAPSPPPATTEPQPFSIVLRDGSTLSATLIMASGDTLHYVDLEDRHMQISMAAIDRNATLHLNRERKLTLYLPPSPPAPTPPASSPAAPQ